MNQYYIHVYVHDVQYVNYHYVVLPHAMQHYDRPKIEKKQDFI